MVTINQYFEFAQLAQAAYATLPQGDPSVDALKDPKQSGFAQQQADTFALGYTVLSQSAPNINGFSATLFKNNATGEKILAIAGTDDLFDGLTDVVSILLLGTTALQFQYQSLKSYYQQLITEGKLGASEAFNVAGHSLGGFLAQSFAVDYAGKVSQTYTYNAPGIGGGIAEVLSAVGVTATNISVSNITNLIAQAGPSATAGLGTMLGNVQNVFIEQQTNPLNNHRMGFLTDSLALYSLFAKLDPSVSIGTISGILAASTNTAANSLESTLATLGRIYGKSYPTAETTRDILYTNLYDLQAVLTTGTVVPLANASRDTLVTGANTDIAYRYALKELNPFAIIGADYTPHNANGELDLFDPATGTGNLTDLYLQDRAAFLTWKNKTYLEDTDVGRLYDGSAWRFKDEASGAELWVGNPYDVKSTPALRHLVFGGSGADIFSGGDNGDFLYGGLGFDVLSGGKGADYLEGQLGNDELKGEAGRDVLMGGQGADTLNGGADSDRLEGGLDNDSLKGETGRDILLGGKGDDLLEGGKDADQLQGGEGNDLYLIRATDNNDILEDSDGIGSIQVELDGALVTLGGGEKDAIVTGHWKTNDNKVSYTFLPDANGIGPLTVQWGDQTLTVRDYRLGQLGLALTDKAPAPAPAYGNALLLEDNYPSNDPVGVQKNLEDGSWTVAGTANDDTIQGGTGAYQIEGGGGFDHLYGGTGNDRIYADAVVDVAAAIGGATPTRLNETIHLLEGRQGDDLLVGAVTNYLYAGAGADTVIGGGVDIVVGDGFGGFDGYAARGETRQIHFDYDSQNRKYVYYVSKTADGVVTNYTDLAYEDIDGKADTIITGGGDDYADGQAGDDYLDLGDGDDQGVGRGGADVIFGGAGNDFLFGDFNWDPNGQTATEAQPINYAGLDAQYHGKDVLDGGAGNDYIQGNGRVDELYGGDGDDTLLGDDAITPGLYHGDGELSVRRQAKRGGNAARTVPRHMARTGYMPKAGYAHSMMCLGGRGFRVKRRLGWKEAA